MKLDNLLQPLPTETLPQPLFVENADLLIVEDEKPIRQLLRRQLEHHGYSCTEAANAREARAHLAEMDFALHNKEVSTHTNTVKAFGNIRIVLALWAKYLALVDRDYSKGPAKDQMEKKMSLNHVSYGFASSRLYGVSR